MYQFWKIFRSFELKIRKCLTGQNLHGGMQRKSNMGRGLCSKRVEPGRGGPLARWPKTRRDARQLGLAWRTKDDTKATDDLCWRLPFPWSVTCVPDSFTDVCSSCQMQWVPLHGSSMTSRTGTRRTSKHTKTEISILCTQTHEHGRCEQNAPKSLKPIRIH